MVEALEPLMRRLRQHAAARTGRASIPTSGDLDGFIRALSSRRGQRVQVLAVPLTGSAPSGAWIPTSTTDYLLYPQGASPTRKQAVLCHELGHILLRHDPALHVALTTPMLRSIAPSVDVTTSRAMLFRLGYSNREEAAAEYVGTLLSAALDERRLGAAWEASSRLSSRLR